MRRIIACSFVLILLGQLSSCSSTMVVVNDKHDNGNHNGWYKNPNNPHNPAHGTVVKTNGNSNSSGNSKGNNGKGNGNGNGKH
jgi:hypothetical protein